MSYTRSVRFLIGCAVSLYFSAYPWARADVDVDKELLIGHLKILEESLNRLSFEYVHSFEPLDGFDSYSAFGIESQRKRHPHAQPLKRDAIAGEEHITQITDGKTVMQILDDPRPVGEGKFKMITDGSLFVYYSPTEKRARISPEAVTKVLTVADFIAGLPNDFSFPSSHILKLSDFITLAQNMEIATDESDGALVVTMYIQRADSHMFDGLRLRFNKVNFQLLGYERFAGEIKAGKRDPHPPYIVASFGKYTEIAPGVSIPYEASFKDIRDTTDEGGKVTYYNYLAHHFHISKLYDYSAKENGLLTLPLPSGTDILDIISGKAYRLSAPANDATKINVQ